jgi:hypothetical protein
MIIKVHPNQPKIHLYIFEKVEDEMSNDHKSQID